MTLAHFLVLCAVALSAIGNYHYVGDTIRGSTKPNRVSFFMWALAPLASSVIAVSAGADVWGTVRVFIGGFFPLLVLLASFYNPQSYWRLDMYDIACGILSLVAFIVWLVVREADVAILLLGAADLLASIPTIRKAWRAPDTETGSSYILYAIASVLGFFAIPVWNIANSAFQIYLLLVNIIIAIPIYWKRTIRS